MKKLISILVAFAMMAMLAVTASFAAVTDPNAPEGLPDKASEGLAVTKTLQVGKDITNFSGDITWTITYKSATGSAASTPISAAPYSKTVTMTEANGTANTAKSNAATNAYSYSTGAITPEQLGFTATQAPGVYTFEVTETMGAITVTPVADNKVQKPDENEKFTLTVLKTADNKFFYTVANEDGVKVEILPGDITGNELQFTNQVYNVYTGDSYENSEFGMSKTVSDDLRIYANEKFNFDFTIVLPAGATDADVVKSRDITTGESYAYDANTNTITGNVKLGNGENFYFTKIPAGAVVSATENDDLVGAAKGSGKAYYSNGAKVEEAILDADAADQKADVINTTDSESTLEGVLTNSIPYIVLALVAIGGMAAYVVIRRRNADEA